MLRCWICFFKLCRMFMIIYCWLLMYLFANVNFSSVSTSFNLRCPNFIIHFLYCIDLDFHSLHLTKVYLHIKDSKSQDVKHFKFFVTHIYLRLISKVKLKKYQSINLIKKPYNKLNIIRKF
jgi:uncharacterized membrane protein YadS